MTTNPRTIRFMRALVGGVVAELQTDKYVLTKSGARTSLPTAVVSELAAQGVVDLRHGYCRARPEARSWLKRQLADADQEAAQHRVTKTTKAGTVVNMVESPLARLAQPANGQASFLNAHHVEAGERIRKLVEQAHLVQRTTMSYDPTRLPSGNGGGKSGDVNDLALDARTSLRRIITALPPDCAGVVLDVCGFLKGLQQVETERQWPRRSAKLVLRIGLEQAATIYGLTPAAVGEPSKRNHNWLGPDARPMEWG